MNSARLAILLLTPAVLPAAGCNLHHSSYAMWPFRSDAAAADFAGKESPNQFADPFQQEKTRLRNESQLAQQPREPQQYAELNSDGAKPFPSSVVQASHQQFTDVEPAESNANPFAVAVENSKWQSRSSRFSAKVP